MMYDTCSIVLKEQATNNHTTCVPIYMHRLFIFAVRVIREKNNINKNSNNANGATFDKKKAFIIQKKDHIPSVDASPNRANISRPHS